MQDNKEPTHSIVTLQFADIKVPTFKEAMGDKYIRFGENDDYPNFLIRLLNKSAKHNAIIRSKTKYIYGGGLKAATADPLADQFIKRYGPIVKKITRDIESFGMCYLQTIPRRDGKGFGFHHLSYKKMRINKTRTMFYFKEDWSDRREKIQSFPSFDPRKKVNSVFMYKEDNPETDVYGLPGFIAAVNWIETDIHVSKHTLSNAKHGFSASKFINFFNGEPAEAQKRSIEARFKDKFTGDSDNKIIIGYNNPGTTAPTVGDLGTSDLTKEDFSQVDELIATNIYAGHEVTNSALFGVPPSNHSLGGNSGAELKIAYEIFKNSYVADKKLSIENIVKVIAEASQVQNEFTLVDIEPVGYTFSETTIKEVAPRSWLMEKLGIDTTKYTDAPVGGAAAPAAHPVQPASGQQNAVETLVNENLKNLSAKQNQHLKRIIREYTKGLTTRAMAGLLLKNSFGFTDDEIAVLLEDDTDEKFSQDLDVFTVFAAHGESRDKWEVFEKRKATFKDDKEYKDLADKIDTIRQANPKATPESIAKTLNVDVKVVEDYLTGASGGAAGGKIPKLPKFEVRYSYEKRADVSGPEILPTTRPFCKKMLGLDRLYSRQDIQKISQYLGYDVMKRAGGFWNNGGTVEYHCRHEFFSQIVVKKK